ncbi:PD-(D/E)XK nuclease superfamily protein [Sharpea azabuensis]|uniref:AAA family ATPase n=1 Tax=Sharpea azabuensis TaxID=322505 RepID=UPI0008E8DFEF|nr:AAA family ATPase [Sharpea azabuensis]SFD96629.1 PD-(D/E)XK nuclease superfamily protein [Sharpea azabuensis]SFK90338.1 PD-(D/E)XK nuclease superfamily protein [Sharpea azabuensis]
MKLIPTGIENFKTLIDKNAYYIDKTNFISEVLNEQVVLYTRPRRFGKTLNMSMLYYFFSNKEKENSYLFDGLNISHNSEAMKHQNQYPVIFLSLKEMTNLSYERQLNAFSNIIYELLEKNLELLESDHLTDITKNKLNSLHSETASIEELSTSLRIISQAMFTHYHQKVIILIDEYDVPMQAAYQHDYYDEMVDFLRSVFSSSLKTNDALEKGIMTGCLRISKESIFTGLNNFSSYSILDNIANECFGFTTKEVEQLLSDYQLSQSMNEVREWYDGYRFGDLEIYNPWSTLSYVKYRIRDVSFRPVSFWANTSSNSIVMQYIQSGDRRLRNEFEQLMNGQSIIKDIKAELTYREMDNINNIYSLLLLTGYLKAINDLGDHRYELVIPNREVYEIYRQSFMSYFRDYASARKNTLYQELISGNEASVNEILNDILMRSISYYDNQESFYHGFLVGLLNDHEVISNREAGDGRFDLCILPDSILGTVVIIECKHSLSDDDLIEDAVDGAKQITDRNYFGEKRFKKYAHAVGYGISFNKKQCYVVKTDEQ